MMAVIAKMVPLGFLEIPAFRIQSWTSNVRHVYVSLSQQDAPRLDLARAYLTKRTSLVTIPNWRAIVNTELSLTGWW